MKYLNYILFFLSLITFPNLFAQFGPEQLITTELENPFSIALGDIDGDTLVDVVVCSVSASDIVSWSKNIDADGAFTPFEEIALGETWNISMVDLDGDNDLDIITAFRFEDEFVWFENLDGQGNFSSKQVVDTNVDGAFEVIAADIDGDNDNDLVATIDLEGNVVWYENLDGQGNFSGRNNIGFLLNGCRTIIATDIDDDDDLDVVAGTAGDKTIVWYENLDGLGNFGGEKVVAGAALAVSDIYCADLDGDNDIDIVAHTPAESKIAWHENLDGLGNFGVQQIITTQATCLAFTGADIDNDDDIDILFSNNPSTTKENSELIIIKNLDGLGNFGDVQILGNMLQYVRIIATSDIDNDSDLDVFATSQLNDKVVWYENLTILSNNDFKSLGIKIYPNPVKEVLVVESPIAIQKVNVYNVLGVKLLEILDNFNEVSMAGLPNGLLLIEVSTEKGTVLEKVVKE